MQLKNICLVLAPLYIVLALILWYITCHVFVLCNVRFNTFQPLYSGVHVCWSEHSDSSFVCGFMSLDYCLGTMTATTSVITCKEVNYIFLASQDIVSFTFETVRVTSFKYLQRSQFGRLHFTFVCFVFCCSMNFAVVISFLTLIWRLFFDLN